jgi:glutamine amidotransferase
MSVAIVDYGSGNLHSAAKAFERAARESGHSQPIVVTRDPDQVRRADRVVLPGVGAFADCKQGLETLPGMIDAMEDAVRKNGRPFLGICVGYQALFDRSEEFNSCAAGLGIFPGTVGRFPDAPGLKVPQIGWNELEIARPDCPLFRDIPDRSYAYFVHSYFPRPLDESIVAARTDYGGRFASAVWRDNVYATQFHPEKSQQVGLQLLSNFLRYTNRN